MVDKQNDMADKQDDMADKQDDMLAGQKRLCEMIGTLQRPKIAPQDKTRKIKYEDLTFDKMLFNKKETSKLYKGEYMKTTVAIKQYTSREMRMTFEKEIENMEDFVSPYIVRMFGIYTKNENGPKPTFLIVMEYCDKGSLTEVLDKQDNLPWQRKARMCLDAALGLYRLHQKEENPKLHGSINSKTFLVDEDFRVKLGSLELARTKRSLKKNDKKDFMRYQSPEQLQSDTHQYCKICEIYSLGIVMWEIATCRKPFDDCNTDAELKKRVEESVNKQVGPLPEDCPKQLGELITECCAYDISQRPNAGVLVDKLRMVVEQLDK